jgi:16S rRNA A1518/A1519 N6-dimethyltransferase RsmA/KsgA/DIM1 with predicted DNA glycosylase/AP lyase activity
MPLVKKNLEEIKGKVWGKKRPPEVKRKKTGIGPDRTTEMSDYFDYAQYDRATRAHAFYQEMIAAMIKSLKRKISQAKGNCRILELGCGNGTLTEKLIEFSDAKITAIDVDKNAIKFVKSKLKADNLKLIRADALKYRSKKPFDVIIASWNYEHITNYKNGHKLAESVVANLKDNGLYIKGAELIAPFKTELERQKTFINYHKNIIDRALKEKNSDTAKIEYLAMVSGITGVSHFKRDKKTLIKEMERGGLKLKKWKKIGPFTKNVGTAGNYVFEFVK